MKRKRHISLMTALAVALIADAAGESGVLPLVQETMVLLWEKVEKRIDTGVVVVTKENMSDPANAELLRPPLEKYLK